MLFILCCFCIVCKYYNTSLLSVEELLNVEHAKDEVDYDDLVDLMETIFVYTEADIDSKNIHYYIELFKFHILEKMEQSTISKKFIQYFEKVIYTLRFSFIVHIKSYEITIRLHISYIKDIFFKSIYNLSQFFTSI